MEVLDNIACESAPVADSHLANKAYVDAAVAGNGTASVSGDNIVSIPAHSLISCGLAPTEDSHLANKAYVDAAVAAAGGSAAAPAEETAGLGKVVYVTTLSDAASHTGTSLRDAINAVTSNGSVVIKFSVSGTITLEQGEITTTGNIVIDGEDKITISGGGVSRIFYIAASNSLKLHRLTLTGGNGIGASSSDTGTIYGGAIYAYGSSTSNGGALFAQGVTFANNAVSSGNATASQGGVVHFGNYTAGIFVDCTFSGNSIAVTKASSTAYGGAISCGRTAYVRCDKCTFSGNTVSCAGTAQGGAVSGGTLVLEKCTFANNQLTGGSTRKGGAINTGTGTIDIIGCEFSGNSVSTASSNCQGGAAFVNTQSVNVIDCTFSQNTAYYGAVYISGGRSNRVLRSVFDNNPVHASGRGAALYVNAGSADIEDCEFKNHAVGGASGIIYAYGAAGGVHQVTINRCLFTGNSGSFTGGGFVYVCNQSQTYLYNCVFKDNTFTGTSGYHRCIYVTNTDSAAFIQNCTFNGNTGGGAFYATANTSLTIFNSVEYGHANTSSGASTATITASKFLSDKASTGRDITYNSGLPLFKSDGYTPAVASQVIDKGLNANCDTTIDLVGNPRVSGTSVDLGAVEFQAA